MGRRNKYATLEEAAEANRLKANLYYQKHKEEKKRMYNEYYIKNREKTLLERKQMRNPGKSINNPHKCIQSQITIEIIGTENLNIDYEQIDNLLLNGKVVHADEL